MNSMQKSFYQSQIAYNHQKTSEEQARKAQAEQFFHPADKPQRESNPISLTDFL
jgi:hypothetical protein